jgi:hypothetical protein
MLPVPYFDITVTVPAEREVLRAHQREGVLMQASAASIIELARDPRYVGGTVAVLTVLHTWTQQLNLRPHVHCPGSAAAASPRTATPGIRRAGSSLCRGWVPQVTPAEHRSSAWAPSVLGEIFIALYSPLTPRVSFN